MTEQNNDFYKRIRVKHLKIKTELKRKYFEFLQSKNRQEDDIFLSNLKKEISTVFPNEDLEKLLEEWKIEFYNGSECDYIKRIETEANKILQRGFTSTETIVMYLTADKQFADISKEDMKIVVSDYLKKQGFGRI